MVYSSAMTFFKRDKRMDNHFENKGGEQNIAQGDHAIGKQQITGNDNIISGTGNVTVNYGVPLERYEQIKKDLDITDALLISFFKILKQGNIPREDWGVRLPEIAFRYKELLQRFEAVTSDDPEVQALKKEAGQAITNGAYDRADELLDQIDERHDKAIQRLHNLQEETAARLEKEQLAKAENLVSRADLQRLQYNYEKAAEYYQEAAAALPERFKRERADCLGAAGYDLIRIASYAEALPLFNLSLSISCEISDIKEVGRSLNNIGSVYQVQGKYEDALTYFEQSLLICQKIDDTEGKGRAINNLAAIYKSKGDYPKALKYLEESLVLRREINDQKGEGGTLNNIGQILFEQNDCAAALRYYEQALVIIREIKDKNGESVCLNNISQVYQAQKKYDIALDYLEQSLMISQQISDRRQVGIMLNNLARIYEDKGDYPAAQKQYEEALVIAKEIGNKDGEACTSWNIALPYIKRGELTKAEPYLSRAVELAEQLEHPDLEGWRKVLEAVRSKLREQQ